MTTQSDVIPLAQLEWFLTFLGIILSWLWDRHFIIELDQGSMNKNSPKLVPKHKLIWKFHILSNWTDWIERKCKGTEQNGLELKCTEQKIRKTELEVLENKRHRTKNKEEEEQLLENESAEPKHKNTSLRHEYQKRRKEGEEKTHEDGCMVGWSRH